MVGWVDGWMDGWKGGWMNGCVDGWMDGWMFGWVNGWMGGWMVGWIDGCMMKGWMYGWMLYSRVIPRTVCSHNLYPAAALQFALQLSHTVCSLIISTEKQQKTMPMQMGR